MNSSPESVAQSYADRASGFEQRAEAHAARSRLVSNLRGLAFGTAVLATGFALFGSAGSAGAIVAAVATVAFFVLVAVHQRVIAAEDQARRWARVNRDGQARVSGRFRELPQRGDRYRSPSHPYADDLDVFGPSSLYQRISVAHTRYGADALAELLSQPVDLDTVRARQEAARELAPELERRQSLEALALATVEPPSKAPGKPKEAPDPGPLLSWAEGAPVLQRQALYRIGARVLPPITVAGMVAASGFGLPNWTWVVPLLLQVVLVLRAAAECSRVFAAVSSHEGAFLRFGAMLELLENWPVQAPLLRALQSQLGEPTHRPSHAMKRFRSGVGWFDLRHNGLIHPFANAILLWDIHCVLRLERWQERYGNQVRRYFEVLGQFEALSSIAGLAYDEPGFVFPELVSDAVFEATDLGHPLIDRERRITNSVQLPSAGTALLITGSNMSGKSTLLRAMGLAAVMGLAGCPVSARALRLGPFRVRTSIRISDSLESGVSHFYAELNKLKAVVDATNAEGPVLFLLDEILHGTNSRERQIGARWVIARLIERGATGAVSTHDMGLVELPEAIAPRVQLVHFRENVENGKMTFDYKLRQGPVTAGNALRLMQIVGLPVPLE